MSHDDGKKLEDVSNADIVLLGVSRTSKTPTSMYLANRGYKTANIPLVMDQKIPEELKSKNNKIAKYHIKLFKIFILYVLIQPHRITIFQPSLMQLKCKLLQRRLS